MTNTAPDTTQAAQAANICAKQELARLDPQEHVDAIYRCAGLITSEAATLHDCHTINGDWGDDHNIKATHAAMLANASAAEAAAEAFIDLQTERDDMLSALVGLVQEPQPLGIDRENYQNALMLVIKYHDNNDGFADRPWKTKGRELSEMLYTLAREIDSEEGCVTESAERVRSAAEHIDLQTVRISLLKDALRRREATLKSAPADPAMPPTEAEALRPIETNYLSKIIAESIAKLGYPVGCGIAPHEDQLQRAANKLFNRFVMIAWAVESEKTAELTLLREERATLVRTLNEFGAKILSLEQKNGALSGQINDLNNEIDALMESAE